MGPPLGLGQIRPRAADVPAKWTKAVCKGLKLSLAMSKTEIEAPAYVSPMPGIWDGNLVAEFKKWGYRENSDEHGYLCDFDKHLNTSFAEQNLNINTRSSSNGGNNISYSVEHEYGDSVIKDANGEFPDPADQYNMVGELRLKVRLSVWCRFCSPNVD